MFPRNDKALNTRANVYEWLFFGQYGHEPYIATVRFWVAFLKQREEWRDRIVEAMAKGYAALGVMETQLQRTPFLTGAEPTVADVALYACIHVAGNGGYDLRALPADQAWLARFAAPPGFAPMPCTAAA